MKGWDRKGLEGLPLKLLMISVMLSLTVPIVIGSLVRHEGEVNKAALQLLVDRVADRVQEVFLSGVGNQRTIGLDDLSMKDTRVRIEIGGPMNGSDCYSIRCWSDGEEAATAYFSDPPVAVCSATSGTLVLDGLPDSLTFTCSRQADRTIVTVVATP